MVLVKTVVFKCQRFLVDVKRDDKSNLSVEFCTLSVQQLVQFDAIDKVHSVRMLTIMYIKDPATRSEHTI